MKMDRLARCIRDTNESSWCSVDILREEKSELKAVINFYNLAKKESTMNINKLHAVFSQNEMPFPRKSDLDSNI